MFNSNSMGPADFAAMTGNDGLPYGTMITTPAATGDVNSISKTIPVQGCGRCGMPKVTITNKGTNPVILQAGSSLYIRPRC